MGLKLNILQLRRNVNFSLVKLLATFVYIFIATFCVVKFIRMNVHQHSEDENAVAWGRISNTVGDMDVCLDHLQKDRGVASTAYLLGQYPCYAYLDDSQCFSVSRAGELRNKHVCATVQKVITKGRQAAEGSEAEEDREAMEVRMGACDEVAVRRWEITPTGQIKFVEEDLCVSSGQLEAGTNLALAPCSNKPNQIWSFEFYAKDFQHLKPQVPQAPFN